MRNFLLLGFRLSDVPDGGALNLEVVWVPIKNYLGFTELGAPENENWVPRKRKSSDVYICHTGDLRGPSGGGYSHFTRLQHSRIAPKLSVLRMESGCLGEK